MRTLLRYALLGLVLLMVMLVSALTAMRLAIHGREVTVPALVGLTPTEAERVALSNGLLVQVESRFYSSNVREGRIMSQSPSAGARVRRGWRLRVAQSLGPQRVAIPDVVGQSARAAELNLQRRGLELGTVAVAHIPDMPPDQVVGQSPLPNASGVASPKINLLVTAPEEPQQFFMPDFAGHSLAEATKTLEGAGLKVGSITSVPSVAANGAPAIMPVRDTNTRLIVRQTPAAGTRVAAGASVTFELSQ